MREVRIGTRGSALALAQARDVMRRLKKKNPNVKFRLVKIKTLGDEFRGVEIFKKSGTGVFTKAIEKKLLSGAIDIAVHSLKDLPTLLARGLVLGGVPKRFPAEDVLISRGRYDLRRLPRGARVGTGSPRRKRQLLRRRPDLKVVDLRGNLDTRVAKALKEKKLDAVVVARAGLLRVKKYLKYARSLSLREMLPAVGQGALGLQARRSDKEILKMLEKIHDGKTEKEVAAERAFLQTLRGGCRVPVGAYGRIRGSRLTLQGAVFSVKSGGFLQDGLSAPVSQYLRTGITLAKRLLKRGAGRFLKEARAE